MPPVLPNGLGSIGNQMLSVAFATGRFGVLERGRAEAPKLPISTFARSESNLHSHAHSPNKEFKKKKYAPLKREVRTFYLEARR
jgi:hypothetical protein